MAEMIRAFVAVLISEDLRHSIEVVQDDFRKAAPRVKWVASENLHVTLKFLGDIRTDDVQQISESLSDAVSDTDAFEVEVGGAGAFPSRARPRTIWIGANSGREKLEALAKSIETQLEKIGFERESKPFKAHITIGRVRDDRDAGGLPQVLREATDEKLGVIRVESIALMRSDLKKEGPTYTKISEIPLRVAERED